MGTDKQEDGSDVRFMSVVIPIMSILVVMLLWAAFTGKVG